MPLDDRGHGLVLRPFRATRYGPGAGADVGAVTSPPYDVIDEETVDRLYSCHPYNVVRLILPRRFAQAPSYDGVSDLLDAWFDGGVLIEDATPALYVYEYSVDGMTVRGLVGALQLLDLADGVVLPHEDVMPGPVADRAELISRTGTNLEPILLVYDGAGAASEIAESVTPEQRVFTATAPDGSTHTVWRIDDPGDLDRIAGDLAPRRALIADGHHRYAAYRQVQQRRSEPDFGFGLAMLVDQQRYPLHLGPIHRVVAGLRLDEAVQRVPTDARVQWFGDDPDAARRALAPTTGATASFLCTDGERWAGLEAPLVDGEIDTHALHDRVLPAWGVQESQLRYVHDEAHAVQEARHHRGLAVLVRPPSVDAVVSAAEHGRSLPRKSTSFGPKPRMGLVMRTLAT